MVYLDEKAIQQLIKAFNERNLEPGSKLFADDVILHYPGNNQIGGDHFGKTGVLLEVEGGDASLAKDISMHIAAMRPSVVSRDDLDPDAVEREREILSEQARQEGKPEKIIERMVEGRLRDFYEQHCLLDQPYVKGEGKKDTVGKAAKAGGMKIVRFIHWELGKE